MVGLVACWRLPLHLWPGRYVLLDIAKDVAFAEPVRLLEHGTEAAQRLAVEPERWRFPARFPARLSRPREAVELPLASRRELGREALPRPLRKRMSGFDHLGSRRLDVLGETEGLPHAGGN
jgi:hypothetical protein